MIPGNLQALTRSRKPDQAKRGERMLTLLRPAAAPLPADALRTALGVRKQTLLALQHRLAAEGLLRRAGREGWSVAVRAVPGPEAGGIGGNPDSNAATR